jgi:hypothetical protein
VLAVEQQSRCRGPWPQWWMPGQFSGVADPHPFRKSRFRRRDTLEGNEPGDPPGRPRAVPGPTGTFCGTTSSCVSEIGGSTATATATATTATTATGRLSGSVDSAAVAEGSPDSFYLLPREGIDWARTRVKRRRAIFHPPEPCTRTSS